MSIPVSVIVVTKNEAATIERCLNALRDFAEIVVVDSCSDDGTREIAARSGARIETFQWDGGYPKKRQWCLDTLTLANDHVLFVDADEVMTRALADEIAELFERGDMASGYFVAGNYVVGGKTLRHGAANAKLALFDRHRMRFPVVDDLDLPGMGEIEGHYQPVFRDGQTGTVGRLRAPLLHHAYGSRVGWRERHLRYAAWEAGMTRRGAWPADPVRSRDLAKCVFRRLPCRAAIAFLHSYVWRLGVLDGAAGLTLALDRARYYRMIARAMRDEFLSPLGRGSR